MKKMVQNWNINMKKELINDIYSGILEQYVLGRAAVEITPSPVGIERMR